MGDYGGWWSSAEIDATLAWNRHMSYDGEDVGRNGNWKENGFSVRCVRD
jgi:hypothetical protein